MRRLHWSHFVLGLWVLISPWLLGFADFNVALWNNLIAGMLIVICSLWELFGNKPSIAEPLSR